MTRRAIAPQWVVARLAALVCAGGITALTGEPRTAAILMLAQGSGMVISRMLSGIAAHVCELVITSAALLLATSDYSPYFAATPLIALWFIAARSRIPAIASMPVYLAFIWSAGLRADASHIAGAVLTISALVIVATANVVAGRTDPRSQRYNLVRQVRDLASVDLASVDLDPVLVATDLLEDLRARVGARHMVLETPDGQRLASIGPEWDLVTGIRLPLSVNGRTLAILIAESPLDINSDLEEFLADRLIGLGTSLAFAEIRSMASDAERSRLSREMHDGIAQEIASIGYGIDDLLADAPETMRPALRDMRQHLTRITSDLRLSIFELRGRDDGVGLGAALSDLVKRVQASASFAIQLRLEESHARFPRAVEDELLRITQEALSNAKRHSKAEHVWVTARLMPPVAELTIEDDGVGLTPGRQDSFGLTVMRERATGINASLTIRDRHGGGTVVYLLLNPSGIGA